MKYTTFRITAKCLLSAVLLVCIAAAYSWADAKYTVKKGDNLYRISKKFGIGTEAISKANDLDSNRLQPGMKLIIPSGKSSLNAEGNSERHAETKNEGIPSASNVQFPAFFEGEAFVGPLLPYQQGIMPEARTHTVKKGDTLSKISRKYSVSVSELKKLNNLRSGRLKLAQVLLLEEKPSAPITDDGLPLVTLANPIQAGAEEVMGPASSKSKLKEFMTFVVQQTLGIRYKFGSNSKTSTDCSGYVQRVFRLLGIQLPRSAREQYTVGNSVDKKNLSIGDLVFFRTYASFPSHVGIYLGNDLFVHASTYAKKVTIDNLNTPYFIKRFIGAKRLSSVNELNISETLEEQNRILSEPQSR